MGRSARQGNAGLTRSIVDQVLWHHFAFEVRLDEMQNAVSFLKGKGIKCYNRINGGESPQVFGWMPAVAIYFDDPDGHLLEFVSMLPNKPRPDIGVMAWEEWNRISSGEAQ